MMPKDNKPADAKPIIDVAHPGKSAPSANSKSVIVNSRPLLKDPMMAAGTTPAAATPDNPTIDKLIEPSAKPALKPLSVPSPESPEAEEAPAAKPDTADVPADQPKPDESQKPEPATNDETPKPTNDKEAKQAEAEATEQAKRQAAIEKLADSKQYYLPINAVEKRRSKRFVIFGAVLSLLLIVAWADIALDAGLIHLGGVKAPTHFFSN